MTKKKAATKVAKYLRNNFGVSFVDAHNLGKLYVKNYEFDGVDIYILESLARILDYDDSLTKVFLKYFKVEYDFYYSECYEEWIVDYKITPLCS